ncbi:MAG: LytTR family DNA-binding domain-containing protein [Paracoccaceae bacterium]
MKSPSELPWTHYLFAAWVLLTVLFTALAPSASEGLSLGARLLFWAVHVGVPLVLLQASQMGVARFASHLSDWISVTVSGFVGALAFVPVAWGLDGLFPEDDDGPRNWLGELVSETLSTVVPVMLVWVALNASRLLRITEAAPAISTPNPEDPTFWAKTPHAIGRDLVSLSAELHYLRVRTRKGDALILYPFGKAVEELAALPGQQVHRSHWVAFAHIKDIERRGDGATVHLTSETSLPVSRKYRKALNEAWQSASVVGAG